MRLVSLLIAIFSLWITGCTWIGWGSHDEIVTTEAEFEQIDVQQFTQNRLIFEGTKKGETAFYIYDMYQKTLSRQSEPVNWSHLDEDVYYLKNNGKVTIETNNGKDRLIWSTSDGEEREIGQASSEGSLLFSIAPDCGSLMYWQKSLDESDVYIYEFEREKRHFVDSFSGPLRPDDISWSGNGQYVMFKEREVYRLSDGGHVLQIDGVQARWSPVGDELLVLERDQSDLNVPQDVEIDYGHRIVKYDVLSKNRETLFPLEREEDEEHPPLVLSEPVWDDQGRFFAFVTGGVSGHQVYFEKVHVMDSQGGFHHVENEQNLRPSTIEKMSFSPDSAFFAYTAANGLLKVLDIPSQKSKVFDVSPQLKYDDGRYLLYTADEAWVLGHHEIRRLSGGLEEKSVYRSEGELVRFFVASDGESLLVIERESDRYQLKYVTLHDGETPSEANEVSYMGNEG